MPPEHIEVVAVVKEVLVHAERGVCRFGRLIV
jgi:hypothetical protein